ncbi:MAG TPA: hypothetical protein PK011_02510, partial [Marinagarivorans sp.]|nr:hypothetical protein [Marinagarivorans sp.]
HLLPDGKTPHHKQKRRHTAHLTPTKNRRTFNRPPIYAGLDPPLRPLLIARRLTAPMRQPPLARNNSPNGEPRVKRR